MAWSGIYYQPNHPWIFNQIYPHNGSPKLILETRQNVIFKMPIIDFTFGLHRGVALEPYLSLFLIQCVISICHGRGWSNFKMAQSVLGGKFHLKLVVFKNRIFLARYLRRLTIKNG